MLALAQLEEREMAEARANLEVEMFQIPADRVSRKLVSARSKIVTHGLAAVTCAKLLNHPPSIIWKGLGITRFDRINRPIEHVR